MLDIHDITEYLPTDAPVNEVANAEIKRIMSYIQQHLSVIETGDEDYELYLIGNPSSLVEKHQIDIVWESETEAYDERIKSLIIEASDIQDLS
jgi:hypothetical protein